jgi:integrase
MRQVDKLSDQQLRRWIKARAPVVQADGGGLTFTLSPAGTAAWVLRYRHAGKGCELTLGQYPDLSLKAARERARTERAEVQNGVHVARERQREKAEAAAAKSFTQLASDYMAKKLPKLAASTAKQRRQHIEALICPRLRNRPAREVTTDDVVSLIESVGRTKTGNVVELVFTALSEIFKHGLAKHAVVVNPCVGVSVAAICGPTEPPRQRLKLTEAELRALLPALPSIGTDNALAAKLLLLTCTRIGELVRAEWSHLDFERAEWCIPDANSKTKKGFIVPLSPAALECFKTLQPLACGSRYVLPARQVRRTRNHGGAEVPFEQRALNAALHKLCTRLGEKKVRRFTPHDLRSSARSHLAALGVNVIVAERCLNHSLGGLVGVYDQHDYLTERRAALETWASFLTACENGIPWHQGNVIPLREAA